LRQAGALQWLEGEGLIQPRADDVTRYLYHAADGHVSYAKARVDKSDQKYQYQHYDGQRWRAGRNGAAAIPYRLPELIAAPEGAAIYMAEGEKHADKLAGWGLVATSLKDWHRNFGKYVKGRTVVILPDNDEPGEKQAADAARLVREGGGKPVLVRLPGLPKSGDIMDWQGTYDDLPALVMEAEAAQALDAPKPAFTRGISAAALMAKHFEPVNYVVPGLLAEGATLFAGKPKIGKSWMAYDFAIAIASGRPVFGSIPITQGDTLYLALEDSERRLKSRLLKKGIRNPPERLTLVTEWPDLDNGCIAELEAWADSVERPSLVIVDVLKMVRGVTRSTESLYDADYRALTGLATFARNRGIAVMIVHHVRKMEADDPLESIDNGSRVVSLPGDKGDVLRGFSAPSLVIFDEAAFCLDEVYQACRPMLAVSGGRLALLSTPHGRRGFFFDAWTGQTEDWQRERVPAEDCPRISREFLRTERATIGEFWFKQEYSCEFVATSDQLFSEGSIERAFGHAPDPLFL
jgi:hypothetical protein